MPRLGLGVVVLHLLVSAPAAAATVEVAAGEGLQQAVAAAAPGDILVLSSGRYRGNVVIDRPLTIQGPDDRSAIIEGDGTGRAIWVQATDVRIRHVTITGSGLSLFNMDAAIFLDKAADRAVVERNDVLDNLIGVYIWGPKDAIVRNNRIIGRTDLRRAERGNGIQLWNTPGSQVISNEVTSGRDGIFTNTSRKNVFRGNVFRDVRFAIHYMYTSDSEISDNVSIGNTIGYAIMYSDRLVIRGNTSDDDQDHGFLFNFANSSEIAGNVVRKSDKCVFIFNANKNQFHDNWFEGSPGGRAFHRRVRTQ